MKKTIIRSISVFVLLFFTLTPIASYTYAQDLSNPLSTIKDKLADDESGMAIDLIDYSGDETWNRLPQAIVNKIENKDFAFTVVGVSISYRTTNLAVIRSMYDQGLLSDEDFINTTGVNDEELMMVKFAMYRHGEDQIKELIGEVVRVLRNILGAFAIFWIAFSGVQMVLARGDESKITEQKQSITYALIGLVAILLIDRGVELLYAPPDFDVAYTKFRSGLSEVDFDALRDEGVEAEILGVVSFIKALIGSVAIFMIVISGLRIMGAQGEEEAITKQKEAILWVIAGIVVIVINQIVVENLYRVPVYNPDTGEMTDQITTTGVQNVINLFGTVIQFILGFVGLIAFGVLVYASGTMAANWGNDEMVENAKKTLKNAFIGLIAIISAFTIVSTVIVLN